MIDPKSLKQFFLYFIVGILATLVEWSVFYLLDVQFKLHYSIATILAFAISTLANWGAGRWLLFTAGDSKGIIHELIAIYIVSCIGLLANILIMYICINWLKIHDMAAKVLATAIVFSGNFMVRKFWIYKI